MLQCCISEHFSPV
uniref:BLTX87 n=1 Tax=Nephila pilipes TaxID=299642 RepID=A0A076KZC6_NEPPI|nr:BLTX87 [Nephila pilipes]